MVRSLGKGFLRRLFFAGRGSWPREAESSPSWEDGVKYRSEGGGDEGTELRSEMSERSKSMLV